MRAEDLVRVEVALRDALAKDAGVDEPGPDRVDAGAARRPRDAGRPGETDDAGLRGAVGRAAGTPARAGDRGDVDDAPPAGLEHQPARDLQAVEGAAQVRVDDVGPVLP